MTRGRKIASIVAASLAGLAIALSLAGIVIVRTEWFRNMVRGKIVDAVEGATGGKVDIASFNFDWHHLRAQVFGLVIHGLEPPDVAPLFRANLVQVDLKLLSPFRGFVDIAYLLVDRPEADLIVSADGRTNIPKPKIAASSLGKSGTETIVDLTIGRFDLRNGTFTFADRPSALNASGANLRAQVQYNVLNPGYHGEIDISPLLVASGNRPPLSVEVKLPFTMEKDKVTLSNAELHTAQSQILLSGSMDHLAAPRTTAQLNARLAVDELANALGIAKSLDTRRGPRILTADVSVSMDGSGIQLRRAHAVLGRSDLLASGAMQSASHSTSLRFNSMLDITELGRLLRVAARPEGSAQWNGFATLDAGNRYRVDGQIDARGISFEQGGQRIRGVSLVSSVTADPRRIALSGLRLVALGGSFTGSAALQDMQQLQLAGNLHNLDIQQAMQTFLPGSLGYDGVLSGPVEASADIRNFATLAAKASLAIAPGSTGIPVSGRIGVDYNGRSGSVTLNNTHLALPHTTADLNGSLGRQIQIRLVSRDFADFQPLATIPATLAANGAATIDATVTGGLSAPHIAGRVALTNFAVDGRSFTSLGASVDATPSSLAIANATLRRSQLQAQFSGRVGMHDWKPQNDDPLNADLTVQNGDLQDILALAGQGAVPASGTLHAEAHIAGTVGSPAGAADLTVTHGAYMSEPFDSAGMHAALSQTAIDITGLSIVAGASRLDANLHYQHGVNQIFPGTLTAHAASNQIQLPQFQSLVKDRPGLRGILTLNADVTGSLDSAASGTEFEWGTLNGAAAIHGLELGGSALGDVTATAASAGPVIRYNVNSNFAGSTIKVTGQGALAGDHQITASASVANLPLDRILAIAGHSDVPLKGILTASAEFAGTLAHGNRPAALSSLNAGLSTQNLTVNQKPLGTLTATAATRGNTVNFNLNSNLANSRIRGSGRLDLTAGYPIDAQMQFNDVKWSALGPLFASSAKSFDASLDGQATLAGSTANPDTLRGSVEFTKLEAHSVAQVAGHAPRAAFELHNQGNVQLSLSNSVVTVQNFKLTGPYSNLAIGGTASLKTPGALQLRADGNVKLDMLQAFSTDIYSSGAVTLSAAITGTTSQPVINGRLQLQKASFNMLSLPNGLSDANGAVDFNGTEAVLNNITGETGGGKVTLTGFVTYTAPEARFRIQATAAHVHIDYPDTVTTEADANLTLTGTSARSLLTGKVTVLSVALHSGSDAGSILTSAATPPSSSGPSTGILGGMRFDVRIQTSPAVQFRTTLSQNLQAEADLTLRGSPDQPGMIGRATVTSGDVVFFGATYSVDEGTVSFFNPNKIDPEVRLSLDTTVQGIDVTLTVSGPMDKLKLAYRSDPPLEFQQIVSLLASGTTPTTDPVLAAHEPPPVQQNMEQQGASALLGQTIANPVSNRLQRLFGVTRLSVNPQISGQTGNTADATLTMQQQVTRSITFTYVQDVSQSEPSAIQIEWAINSRFSAIAKRDVFGEFALDFVYKRHFH